MGDRRHSGLAEGVINMPLTVPPSSDEQVRFLVNVQRLLDEGLFVATYKDALLLSLADLCIERGDDSGVPLPLATEDIAERFVQYYWRRAAPFARTWPTLRTWTSRDALCYEAEVIEARPVAAANITSPCCALQLEGPAAGVRDIYGQSHRR